ncbi:MAG: hypothetical protein IJF08_02500 [Clostridia bacterium]|nr:hypothetical protein [Clostridia bacterium]
MFWYWTAVIGDFSKAKKRTPTSNCRRKIAYYQAHRRTPGEGDLTIVEPRARSNAVIGDFSKAKISGRGILDNGSPVRFT